MWWRIVLVVLLTLCLGLWVLRYYNARYAFASQTRTYTTLAQSDAASAASKGWLPGFLPTSSRNIYEKVAYDDNRTLVALSFDPSEDLAPRLAGAQLLTENDMKTNRPSWIGKSEAWFLNSVVKGRFDELASQNYKFYRAHEERDGTVYSWCMAIKQETGSYYAWMLGCHNRRVDEVR